MRNLKINDGLLVDSSNRVLGFPMCYISIFEKFSKSLGDDFYEKAKIETDLFSKLYKESDFLKFLDSDGGLNISFFFQSRKKWMILSFC